MTHLKLLTKLVGKRGSFLLFLAILDFTYGYSFVAAPSIQQKAIDLVLPWHAWSVIWITVGVVCFICSFVKRDWPAFGLASMLKVAWAAVQLRIWLLGHIPRAWLAALVFITFSLVILVVGSWPEPPSKVIHPKGPGE